MPRRTSEAANIGARGPLPPPSLVALGYNPKFEFDAHDEALAEFDTISPDGPGEGSSATSQKLEPESGPSSGVGNKRKRPLKLTPSQRERKRAIDREAQRSIRIKTKNYIAHLENLVKVMEQSDSSGPDGENSRMRELMNQLKQSQDEVRSLREAMLGIQRTLSTVLSNSSILNPDLLVQRQPSYSASPPSASEAQHRTVFTGPSHTTSNSQTSHLQPPAPPQIRPSTNSIPVVHTQPDPPRQRPPNCSDSAKFTPLRPRREAECFTTRNFTSTASMRLVNLLLATRPLTRISRSGPLSKAGPLSKSNMTWMSAGKPFARLIRSSGRTAALWNAWLLFTTCARRSYIRSSLALLRLYHRCQPT